MAQAAQRPANGCTGRVGAINGIQQALDFAVQPVSKPRGLAAVMDKRQSKAARILERLRQGPATTLGLAQIGGIRFGARLLELRQQGYRIKTEPQGEYAIYSLEV